MKRKTAMSPHPQRWSSVMWRCHTPSSRLAAGVPWPFSRRPGLRGVMTAMLAAFFLAGCGSVPNGTSDLVNQVAVGNATCLVVDLDASTVRAEVSLTAALALSGIRDSKLVLVRVPAGSVSGGSGPGVRWGLPDEVAGAKGSSQVFVSVFEITRGQWRRMAGSQPWSTMPADLVGSGDSLPACGVSLDAANAVVSAAAARVPGRFSLPTSEQWEYLARGGSTARYPWGDSNDPSVAGLYAVTADTVTTLSGPQRTGSLAPNGFGLYDVAGNAWELTSDGTIHGGSWIDGLPMARSANRISLDQASAHALVGVRFLYRPANP